MRRAKKLARGRLVLGGLTLFLRRLTLGPHARNHLPHLPHPDSVRDFQFGLVVVDHFCHFADQAARRHHGVAAADVLHQFGVVLHLLLLRPQNQEIHDHEDQRERQQRHQHAVGIAAGRGLGKRRCNQHSDNPRGTGMNRQRIWRLAGSGKFARTIAAAVPIATLPEPSFALDLSGFRGTKKPDKAAWSGTSEMSKKPRKTRPHVARKSQATATTRPAEPAEHDTTERIVQALETIAAHLSAASPKPAAADSLGSADAFVWHPNGRLAPVPRVSRVDLDLLRGIDRMRDILIENTERFANGLPANNALLWGARGMGKSSLVKAAHASINVNRKPAERLKLIEIHREDIESLPGLMELLRVSDFRFLVFCDDLSFDGNDASYKSLKAVLEGGIEGRPDNVILYAPSNRRHLLAREMIENERSTAINPGEAVEEKVSLSDRFGLWLGFHRCSQDEYLAMVKGYCAHFGIKLAEDELEREALEWSTTRGSRSGRVAWQFTQELAGLLGIRTAGK